MKEKAAIPLHTGVLWSSVPPSAIFGTDFPWHPVAVSLALQGPSSSLAQYWRHRDTRTKTHGSNARSSCHDCNSEEVSCELSHPEMVTHNLALQELSKSVFKLKQDMRNTLPVPVSHPVQPRVYEVLPSGSLLSFYGKIFLKSSSISYLKKKRPWSLPVSRPSFCPELLDLFLLPGLIPMPS